MNKTNKKENKIITFVKNNRFRIIKSIRLEAMGQAIFDYKEALKLKTNECIKISEERDAAQVERDEQKKLLKASEILAATTEATLRDSLKQKVEEIKEWDKRFHRVLGSNGGYVRFANQLKRDKIELNEKVNKLNADLAETIKSNKDKDVEIEKLNAENIEKDKLIKNVTTENVRVKNKPEPATVLEQERYNLLRKGRKFKKKNTVKS